GRFRVTVVRHAAGVAATLRPLPAEPPTLAALSLPALVPAVLALDSGLVVVTGPHGSGRSTTLAALVRHLNQTRRGRIVTIEDPIEPRHVPLQCAMGQREVGTHAPSLEDAVRDAMRADADVVLLADLHEPAAAAAASSSAAAGTLVLGALDAPDATHAVDRLVSAHAPARRDAARARLASHLRMVVTQRLVRHADGSGRRLVADAALAPPTTSTVGAGTRGLALATPATTLASLDAALLELVRTGAIHRAEAFRHALDPGALAARATSEAA
ncbi:MAG: ATPase, T2SS/T4P/T4SS family, partial [bacterium]